MTEYWLQKKTIGGWSMVTWYSDLEQAQRNYNNCVQNGNSGYSWRLCKVEAIEENMLEDVLAIEAPEIEVKKTSWGAIIETPKQTIVDYGNEKPKRAWGDINTKSDNFWGNNPSGDRIEKEHGLTGSVWVIHHQQKIKKRIAASEVDSYLAQGYVKGGPKTKYEE